MRVLVMIWVEYWIVSFCCRLNNSQTLLWRMTKPDKKVDPGNTWRRVMDKDINDLHL